MCHDCASKMPTDRLVILRTERLLVRAATLADAELYHVLWTSPSVMGFVGFPRGLRISRREIRQKLRQPHTSELGRPLVAELLASGEAIGECYMSELDEDGVVDPDVKLLPSFWGHKYGVELWRAMVAYLFLHTACVAVHGTPNIQNIASIRMQEAAGATRVGEGVFEFPAEMSGYSTPVPYYVYRLTRQDWEHMQTGPLAKER